ncbi:cephalosporin-C deacetylase [Halanaerobium saccharolyticum]|uniref:Cephalosporin-C deacetylase n=1 Tax=Halanaerobium saccharolyticum TaxID=43595 RepID=A0A4R7Z189_9FIRM|nr:acetylxylan esterase [Halanaerobium saccharolyticum]RAK07885.1 cephalosporin-C deacetylase [Halanaerobium saccharolyticum]TDW04499.1 cephalosporin-C deacetylase [Halanaerobium saccharolyticum]TDX59835.1 cephalosporin-C deacetylase [Halanaerobium saccharolyticum]
MLFEMSVEEMKKYKGSSPRADDFDQYWEKALAEMKTVDPNIEIKESAFQTDFAECYDLYFTGVKDARIHVKYIKPKMIEKKHPAVIEFHGYGSRIEDWADKLQFAARGYSYFGMDCRGQNAGFSEDVGGVKGNTKNGHIIRGLADDPDKLYYRNVFLDTAQLAEIVMKMESVDQNRVGVYGYSQGGALTIACAALEPRIKKAAPVYSFLCDYKRVTQLDIENSAYAEIKDFFRKYDPLHIKEEEIFNKLSYIDIQNLADRIEAEVLMTTAISDPVCPPSTQFAVYNKIESQKEMVIYPDYGHEDLPGIRDRHYRFFNDL